jgi:hypothetical protein
MGHQISAANFAKNAASAIENKNLYPETPSDVTYIAGAPSRLSSLRAAGASPDPARAEISGAIDRGIGFGDQVNNEKNKLALDYAKRFMNQFSGSPFSGLEPVADSKGNTQASGGAA